MKDALYPIMEHFYSIQGEGYNVGIPAYFVRLAGCNVGCHWCDVKESWSSDYPLLTSNEIVQFIKNTSADKVILTGGEPTIHDLTNLTDVLNKKGFKVFLETSGSAEITGDFTWICLSPKKALIPKESSYLKADELKIVIFNKSDFSFAEEQAKLVSDECILFLQPEWSKKEQILPDIIEYIKEHNHWRLSIQAHNYINVP